MSTWLSEDQVPAAAAPAARANGVLRLVDVMLAALALLLLWPLALLALAAGARLERSRLRGAHGAAFERLRWALPATRLGRVLQALGLGRVPVLLNILQGHMAWVGPRARAEGEALAPACAAVRPGLVNPWFIRRRTAVDFGSEELADLQYLARRGLRHDMGLLLRGALVALLPPPALQVPERVQIGDVGFDNVNMGEALAQLRDMLDGPAPQQVSFVNPACVNIAAAHRGYRRVLARAALVLPDGIGIKIGSALLGTPLKQNVNGTDLFPRLCEMLQARGASVFLLGGQPGVAEGVAAQIAQRWPQLRVAGLRHGFFSVAEEGEVVAQVRDSGADMLLVARGVPSQDLFIDRHLSLLGVKVAMGVGGLFDFVCGRISRAPLWMRETGLEWVWRLMQEPGRMWRRYLVGNFTFLVRVALQRVGLRKPAEDVAPQAQPTPRAGSSLGHGVRAVIFATGRAPADVPVDADLPAALLPLGSHTLIEQLMAQLAQAAIPDVHLIVSERPEALRALLEEGSRWGLHLTWHLAKDPARPYAVLGEALHQDVRRLVIGHADRCPDATRLMSLAHDEQMAQEAAEAGAPAWCGWASVAPQRLQGLPAAGLAREALGQALREAGVPVRTADAADGLALSSATRLLQAQPLASADDGSVQVPASWIRRPWGAMSPQARVEPGVELAGPVLVGPGCIIESGASVGPHVVLSRDVVVCAGTHVNNTLVLPGTYVGEGLELSNAIVNGARLRHLTLDVEMVLPAADAVLLSLSETRRRGPTWLGRACAGALLALAAPLLLAHVAWRRLLGRGRAWTLRHSVAGCDAVTRAPLLVPLRCARPRAAKRERLIAGAAGLLDVAVGRRTWFGMRPRTTAEWNALSPEWQHILADSPVGLLHAPAWRDPAHQGEANAAADVYAAVLSPLQRGLLLLKASALALLPPRRGQAR